MSYAIESALFQWEEGERRLREAPGPERAGLQGAAALVHHELRRRLGSTFTIEELGDLYATGVDWAADLAREAAAEGAAAWVVDAAFNRYAREASNFAGGRRQDLRGRGPAVE